MDYNIYIKLTNGCNLQCKHCYNEIMKNHTSMSQETLETVILWIKNFRKDHPEDDINMSLHGGEPMLYDLDKIILLIDSLSNLNLKWCVTTNLMYEITDKHISIFKNMKPFDKNPMIMTSYDFGDTRFDSDDKIELWKKNVGILKAAGIDIQPIICLTKYVIKNIKPQQVYDFISQMGLHNFNFERITETGRASVFNVRPDNNDLNDWLFEAYKIYENLECYCPLFESITMSLKGIFLGCRARQCMEKVITINPDGTIGGCPNTADKVYTDIDGNENYQNKKCDLVCQERNPNEKCLVCPYYKWCKGDCFQLKWDETGCPGPQKIYEYLLRTKNEY